VIKCKSDPQVELHSIAHKISYISDDEILLSLKRKNTNDSHISRKKQRLSEYDENEAPQGTV